MEKRLAESCNIGLSKDKYFTNPCKQYNFCIFVVNTHHMINIVYGLVDPRNDLVYYVGKSSVGEKRPITHLVKQSHSKKVNDWVDEMQKIWHPVKAIVLEEVDDINELPEVEKKWIRKCKYLNPELLNHQIVSGIISDCYSEEDDLSFNRLCTAVSTFKSTLRRRRLALNLTQESLGALAGVHRTTIRDLELGKSVSTKTLRDVTLALVNFKLTTDNITQLRKRAGSINDSDG